MKYFILYIEEYLPQLKSRYYSYNRYGEQEKIDQLFNDIDRNMFLTDKQKDYIKQEIKNFKAKK